MRVLTARTHLHASGQAAAASEQHYVTGAKVKFLHGCTRGWTTKHGPRSETANDAVTGAQQHAVAEVVLFMDSRLPGRESGARVSARISARVSARVGARMTP